MLLFLDIKLRTQLNQNANQVGWDVGHTIIGFYSSSFQKEMKYTSSSYIYVEGMNNEPWKLMDSCNGILVEVYVYMGPCIGTLNLYTKCIYSMSFLPLVLHMLMLRPWEGWVCFSQ